MKAYENKMIILWHLLEHFRKGKLGKQNILDTARTSNVNLCGVTAPSEGEGQRERERQADRGLRTIMKTYLYNSDPLKPHFYSKTGVYRGIHYFSYFWLLKNIDCEYSLKLPQ